MQAQRRVDPNCASLAVVWPFGFSVPSDFIQRFDFMLIRSTDLSTSIMAEDRKVNPKP